MTTEVMRPQESAALASLPVAMTMYRSPEEVLEEAPSPVDGWADSLDAAPTLAALKSRWEVLVKGGGFETFTPEERGRLEAIKDKRKGELSQVAKPPDKVGA